MTKEWFTVAEMAALAQVSESRVASVLVLLGVIDSKVNARDSARGREYSAGVATLVGRELRSRGEP